MPRLADNRNPKLSRHAPSGQGRVRLAGRDHWLGVWPADQSDPPPPVREAYNRHIADWLRAGRPTGAAAAAVTGPPPAGLTVDELILRYLAFADGYYTDPDGQPTKEAEDIRLSLRPLSALYGSTPAAGFGARAFKLVRDEMVRAGLCRRIVNQRAGRVRRAFRWAAAEELVPAAVYHAVQAVESLRPGRSAAPESEPVRPVDPAHVDATLPFLTRPVAAMVRLQLLSGCRPGEVVQMRTCDLDTSGEVWTFAPQRHKGRWRGRPRVVYLGPRAQEVVRPFLRPDSPEAFLFSPAEAMREFRAAQRAARTTPLTPAQVWEKKAAPQKAPRDRYDARSYAKAVGKACKRAGVPGWCPLMLRHTAGTEARRLAGLEAAQAHLGHARANVTEVYAERVDGLGKKVAMERG